MTSSPLITIIIPVYNRAGIVTETLNSVAAQTERPLALVIVDNNSTDNSLEVVTRWSDSHRCDDFTVTVVSEKTPGAAAARNTGMSYATSPYIMFFDSDDIMAPSHVKDFADAFRNDPTLDIAGRDVIYRQLDGKTERKPFADTDLLFRHTFNAILSTQRYAARKTIFERAGLWDTTVMGWNDYELGMRILMLSPKITRIDDLTSLTVISRAESITGTAYSAIPEKWEHSLDLCEATLLANGYDNTAIQLRRIVLAALYRREKSPESSRLLHQVLESELRLLQRLLFRFAFLYTAAGGRGIHLILRKCMKIFKDV